MNVKSITHLKCGKTSYNPNDVMSLYCGHCHEWINADDFEFNSHSPDENHNSLLTKYQNRIAELEQAIRNHRDQKADDRCIEDDDRLYEALGDGIKCDRRVGSKFEMLKNCARFIDRRCEEGQWKTYAELEKENEDLWTGLDKLANVLGAKIMKRGR